MTTVVLRAYENDQLAQEWNDEARIYTDFRADPPINRPYTAEENAAADERALYQQVSDNKQELSDPSKLLSRLQRLDAYDEDPDVVAALSRSNSTVLTTQELNRLLKVMLRRQSRITAALALAIRLIDPSLLIDISDSADA